MSYIVGLTGGIGSGKSTIADLFRELNVSILDADVVARQIVEKCSPILKQIVEHFGESILDEGGHLNRSQLRQIIFQNEAEKNWLNQLLHPAIQEQMKQQIAECQAPYLLFVVPLLIENKLDSWCDRILVIDVQPDIQLKRASLRDKNKEEIIKSIMASQVSREIRLTYADDIIENNLPINENLVNLKSQVNQLHQHYLTLAQQKREK